MLNYNFPLLEMGEIPGIIMSVYYFFLPIKKTVDQYIIVEVGILM